jgi:DNA-binding FadR family transcriptional regulator
MSNGQYEDYLIVSQDEADARIAELEAERNALREALQPFARAADWQWEATVFAALDAAVLQNGDGEQITRKDMENAKQIDDAIESDMRFHRTLADDTCNPIFVVLLETLTGLMRESQYLSYDKHGLQDAAGPNHHILEAIKKRDSKAAKKAMETHI